MVTSFLLNFYDIFSFHELVVFEVGAEEILEVEEGVTEKGTVVKVGGTVSSSLMMYSSMKQSSPVTRKFRFDRFFLNSKLTFLMGRRLGRVDASFIFEVFHSFDFS